MVPSVVYMALTEGAVAVMTLKMIDVFVSIFLAVLWYSVWAQALDTFGVLDNGCAIVNTIMSVIAVVFLYAVANRIAFYLRGTKTPLITFGSCAGHFIAFAGIGMCNMAQFQLSKYPGNSIPITGSFLFCVGIVVVFVCVSLVNNKVWLGAVEHHLLREVLQEMELDIIGLVLTYCVTQAFRHLVAGVFPPLEEHQAKEHLAEVPHVGVELAAWLVSWVVIGCVLLPRVHTFCHNHSIIHLVKVSVIMLVAWSYLEYFDWFFETYGHTEGSFGHTIFATLTTFAALTLLQLTAFVDSRGWSKDFRETRNIGITGVALTAAWSWEHCYKEAFDVVGERYQVGYKGLVPKLFLALVLPCFMLPPYVMHIKTRVIRNEEAEAEDMLDAGLKVWARGVGTSRG
ncbi:unnamed protein product [Effrenium voratum]|nr:unnamed protein product [Effrenium voratum]